MESHECIHDILTFRSHKDILIQPDFWGAHMSTVVAQTRRTNIQVHLVAQSTTQIHPFLTQMFINAREAPPWNEVWSHERAQEELLRTIQGKDSRLFVVWSEGTELIPLGFVQMQKVDVGELDRHIGHPIVRDVTRELPSSRFLVVDHLIAPQPDPDAEVSRLLLRKVIEHAFYSSMDILVRTGPTPLGEHFLKYHFRFIVQIGQSTILGRSALSSI